MEFTEGIGFKREKLVNSDMLQRVQKGQKIGLATRGHFDFRESKQFQ